MKVTNQENKAALFIPAGLFIGTGIGFFVDQIVGGVLVGLGIGFLIMAMINILKK